MLYNALSESVNGTLKNELVYRTAYRTQGAWMILRMDRARYNRMFHQLGRKRKLESMKGGEVK